jgi:hypothetical protein
MSQSDEKNGETKQSSVSNPFTSDKSALKESNSPNVDNNNTDKDIVNPFATKMSVSTEGKNDVLEGKPKVNPFTATNKDLYISEESNNNQLDKNDSKDNIASSEDKNNTSPGNQSSLQQVVNDNNLKGAITYSRNESNSKDSIQTKTAYNSINISVADKDDELESKEIDEAVDALIAKFKDNPSKEVQLVKQIDGSYTIKTNTPFPAGRISPEIARLYRYKLPLFRNVAVNYGTSMSALLKDLYNPELVKDKDRKEEAYGRIEYYYNHGEEFLHYVKNNLNRYYSSNNKNVLIDEIKDALYKVRTMEDISKVIPLPLQLILGLMLLRLKSICSKNKGEFGRICHENFGLISQKSRNNYMNAARLLSYNNIEKYLTCELTIQYRISELFKKKDKNGKPILDKDADNPILEAFLEISNGEAPDERDFDRVAGYVTFWKVFSIVYKFNFDKQRFHDLFKSSYSISKGDFSVVEKHGLKKIGRGKYSIVDKDFVNKYIDAILKNHVNRELALDSLGIKPKKQLSLSTPMKNKENFSITVTKMLEITKDYAENSTKINQDDYNNIQKIKEYISVIEQNFNASK